MVAVFENEDKATFLGLCAYEWECVSFGVADALDGKPITPENFLGNLALYSTAEWPKYTENYHYYRYSGASVGYVKNHWVGISATVAGAFGLILARGAIT